MRNSECGTRNLEWRSPHVSKGGSSELIFIGAITAQAETRPVGRVSARESGIRNLEFTNHQSPT